MEETGPQPGHFSVERYFEMAECGILSPDDRVDAFPGVMFEAAELLPSPLVTVPPE